MGVEQLVEIVADSIITEPRFLCACILSLCGLSFISAFALFLFRETIGLKTLNATIFLVAALICFTITLTLACYLIQNVISLMDLTGVDQWLKDFFLRR